MSDARHDQSLVRLVRQGDQAAAKLLYDRYVERLLPLAKKRLSQRLASRVDPEDVVQSVFKSLFVRLKEGQFQIEDPDDLCKLLVRMTVHKTLRQVHHHKAGKRDPGAEVGQGEEGQQRLLEVLSRGPTPEAETAFVEQLEGFFTQLRPQERRILEMRLQGYSNEEIAAELNIYDRKIRRILERIRGIAEREGITPDG